MFRSDENHRYFKVTFAGPSQAVLRRCAAALQSRFESRQRPIWDWAMDFGSMSGEGAFVLLSWPAKSPTTFTNAYQTVSRHIGGLCDDWQLRPLDTSAPDASYRAATPTAAELPGLAHFVSSTSQAALSDCLTTLPLSSGDLRKLQAAAVLAVSARETAAPAEPQGASAESGAAVERPEPTDAENTLRFLEHAENSILPAERGQCRFVHGFLSTDLLDWLCEEPLLRGAEHGHDFWRRAAWHRASDSSWQMEAGVKLSIGGDLGEGSLASSVNGLASQGLVFERNAAFVRALLAKNKASFYALVQAFKQA